MNSLQQLRRDPRALTPPEIPARFQGAEIKDVPNLGLRKIAVEYIADFWNVAGRGIGPLLLGKAGTYKTFTAAYIARLVHVGGIETRFVQAKPWLTQLELNRFADPKAAALEIKRVSEVPFLVFDDFATATAAPSWQADTLLTIAEARFSNLRPTLWTGNVLITRDDTSKLDQLYGAVFSRRVFDASEGFRLILRA